MSFWCYAATLTWNIRPLWWHETILSLHNVTQHNHLFTMPKRRTADKECKHDDTTGPTGIVNIRRDVFEASQMHYVQKLTYRLLFHSRAHCQTCCIWGFLEPDILVFHTDLQINVSQRRLVDWYTKLYTNTHQTASVLLWAGVRIQNQ